MTLTDAATSSASRETDSWQARTGQVAKPVEDAPHSRVRVAIINDFEVVVEGLAAMMRHHLERVDVIELDAAVGQEGRTVSHSVDIALLDTFAHSADEVGTIGNLTAHDHVANVVVYAWACESALIERSLSAGARGYLSKSLPASELVDAFERICQGEIVVNPATSRPTTPVAGDWPGREEGLTPRESEVLALITRGLTNEQIAATTRLSPNSVKSYIRGAYRKIGVSSRTRAVLWALDHGFSSERHDDRRGA